MAQFTPTSQPPRESDLPADNAVRYDDANNAPPLHSGASCIGAGLRRGLRARDGFLCRQLASDAREANGQCRRQETLAKCFSCGFHLQSLPNEPAKKTKKIVASQMEPTIRPEIVVAAGGGEGRARRIDRDEAATQ